MKALGLIILLLSTNFTFAAISKKEFETTISKVQNEFAQDVQEMGAKLAILGNWSNSTINAHTSRSTDSKIWKVHANGGFARLKFLNQDGFTILLCHELGHHLGGYPKVKKHSWLSVEGQADYFATLKCSKRIFSDSIENSKVVSNLKVSKFVTDKCTEAYANVDEVNVCIRSAMASKNLIEATNIEVNKIYNEPLPRIEFDINDRPYAKGHIYQAHSELQCRLNTLFNGSLCNKDVKNSLSDTEESSGNCSLSQGDILGVRPNCWYYPNE
ncbi:ImmA/IrrE family metallo-endopeptidase [Peredibacter sp. HCB2-198]|uniref:ImmA/IrrE family metallo-endopeptidase n=1 Tax=Peredibacter sp. HCB2-198 TaxID=3383025 RepID=UPI0038B4F1DF